MKKIALIVPVLSSGGVEAVVSTLSQNIGDDVLKVIILYNSKVIAYPYSGHIISLNVKIGGNFILKIFSFIKKCIAIKRIKKKCHFDAVVSFQESANLINVMTRCKEKVVVSTHSYKSNELNGIRKIFYKVAFGIFYNMADRVVAVSKGVGNDLVEKWGVKGNLVEVIYNPVDGERIKCLAEAEINDDEKTLFGEKTLVIVGRLSYEKGQRLLLTAFSDIAKERQDVNLLIIGEGPDYNFLKDTIIRLNLKNRVFLLGYQANPYKYIRHSSCLILYSLWEGFGLVLVESLLCGTPVIAVDCLSGPAEILGVKSGGDDIIQTPYGYLIPAINEDNLITNQFLCTAINSLLCTNFRVNLCLFDERFSLERCIQNWRNLL